MEIIKDKDLTRDEISSSLNKPRSTIYDNLEKLEENNMVMRYSLPENCVGKGRPPVYWSSLDY